MEWAQDLSNPSSAAKDKQIQSATQPLQIYSRKKEPLVQPMQVHNSKSTFGVKNIEVTPNS